MSFEFKYCPVRSDGTIDLTLEGKARKFKEVYKDKARYSPSSGWLVWNGVAWEQNEHAAELLWLEYEKNMMDERAAYARHCHQIAYEPPEVRE